jgi:hypothetical protein
MLVDLASDGSFECSQGLGKLGLDLSDLQPDLQDLAQS